MPVPNAGHALRARGRSRLKFELALVLAAFAALSNAVSTKGLEVPVQLRRLDFCLESNWQVACEFAGGWCLNWRHGLYEA